MRGAAAAVMLAFMCVGGALRGMAAPNGSTAQDLLLRWTPPEKAVGPVRNAVFGFALAVSAVSVFRSRRRGDIDGLFGSAGLSAVFVAGWVLGPELAVAWVSLAPAPGWVR